MDKLKQTLYVQPLGTAPALRLTYDAAAAATRPKRTRRPPQAQQERLQVKEATSLPPSPWIVTPLERRRRLSKREVSGLPPLILELLEALRVLRPVATIMSAPSTHPSCLKVVRAHPLARPPPTAPIT